MSEMQIRTVPPKPKGYGVLGFVAGILLTAAILCGWRATLPPVQRVNLIAYVKASAMAPFGGLLTVGKAARETKNQYVSRVLREQVYGGQSVWELAMIPLGIGALLTFGLMIFGTTRDSKFMRGLRQGRLLSGPELVTRAEFNIALEKEKEAPGVGFLLKNSRSAVEVRRGQEGYVLRIPKRHEAHHFSISGAPGSGKTQTIMQLIDQVADRADTDTAVIWDPTGVLTERYYDAKRGDVILNPLDARCPAWNPAWELSGLNALDEATARAMGSSLYVGRAATTQDGATFFSDTSIDLWTQIITHSPPREAQELAYWMAHPDPELDRRVVGSKCEQDLNKNAAPQRNGILSSFCMVQQSLASVPTSEQAPMWTVKDWCEQRKGWIFLTSTPDTSSAIRPLQSLWIDMIIRRLMALRERPDLRSVWFFFDELAELQRLPMLEPAMNQGRKFGIRMVLGFQAMSQVEYLYGKDQAQAILAAPGTQTYMRTMENQAAEWMAKQCGKQRLERLVESFPATWAGSNKGQSVRTEIVDTELFLPSVFMGLPDMHGILRHGNHLVRIHLPHLSPIKRCTAFIPRPDVPTVIKWVSDDTGESEPLEDEEAEPVEAAAVSARGRNPALYNRGAGASSEFRVWREKE